MPIKRWTGLLPVVFMLIIPPAPGWSRENNLTATLALRQEYDSNLERRETDRQSGWYSVLRPGLQFASRGRTDQWQARYHLGFRKNHTTGVESLDHDFLLRGEKAHSARRQTEVLNRFYISDDSEFGDEPVAEVDPQLSPHRTRERFRSNTFALNSRHQFAARGTVTLSYENRILDNRDSTRDDYMRHHPRVVVSYGFNPRWQTEVAAGYIRGDFDQADDLVSHTGNWELRYRPSVRNQFFLGYGFNQTDYRGDTPDYQLHSLNSGWTHYFNPQTNLTLSAGVTRLERRGQTSRDHSTFALDLKRQLRRGSVSLSGRGGIDERQFAGGDEGDLVRYRQAAAVGRYQLTKRLGADLTISRRDNDYLDRPLDPRERTYEAGCGLSYRLSQNHTIATRYRYRELDSSANFGNYQVHRWFVELSGTYPLRQW